MSEILGSSLPEEAYRLLRSKIPTVIVATVSEEGRPNTTPIHLAWAKDRNTILMGMAKRHDGTKNIEETGKAMICMCEKGDVNVSIYGTAKVMKEQMDCNEHMSIIKFDVEQVKDDSTHSRTTSGIRWESKTAAGDKFIEDIFNELECTEIS
ncbi:MAG: pyridoxamine 5'-phosphate oxidase family protein [Thermoplasmata archaeon]